MVESPQVREWQAEARRETRREYVRWAIQLRFATPMPPDLEEKLAALKREAELDRWFEVSQVTPSLDAFRAAVRNRERRRERSE